MAGCGREFNGNHKVEGASLRCGANLYWRLPNSKITDKTREHELLLCPLCKEK
jgi:hypothetical protein